MALMLDLADVLQEIKGEFNDSTFANEQFVTVITDSFRHVLVDIGEQLDPPIR